MWPRGEGGPGAAGGGAAGGDEPGQPDAVLLAPLTEDTFLHNLHVRYMHDVIYTYVGHELISVNPCRALPLYAAELVRAYLSRPPHTLPPHLYAVVAAALRWARDRQEYQCIVMTGESGSGKTEAARVCLQAAVLAGTGVGGGGGEGASGGGGGGAGGVGGALTAAGTLLEAFGNAATARNHNASRFGKLLDLELDFRGEPVGGHITHFLLEKSRASGAGVGAGERNFHVLYQLLAGADVSLLKRLKLQRSWESYRVLAGRGGRGTGCGVGVGAGGARSPRRTPPPHDPDDAADTQHFAFTKAAMVTLGFGAAERGGVLRVLAFILKLGNVGFEPTHNIDGSLGARLTHAHELEEACALVGVCARSLAAALGAAPPPPPHVPPPSRSPPPPLPPPLPPTPHSHQASPVHNDSATDSSSESGSGTGSEEGGGGVGGRAAEWGGGGRCAARAATARRDRLVAAVYARLFTWLVAAVNARLAHRGGGAGHAGGATLGILDVYGLESLSHNGLERLLINYAAERVQAAVGRAAARAADEALRDGLPSSPAPLTSLAAAPHPPSADLLDLGPESLLALVERSSAPGGGGGAALITRLQRKHHPRLLVLPPQHFQVVHFGGPVVYSARGMPGKNRDAICRRAADALHRARDPLLSALFPPPLPPAAPSLPDSPRHGGGGGGGLAARQRALVGAATRRLAAPGSARVVRCLRPDAALRPRRFDPQLVRHQLRTQGIVEMAQWRRAGWCESMCARALLQRYGLLGKGGGVGGARHAAGVAGAGGSPHGAVAAARALLRSLPIPSAEFAFGRTKVFIRSPRTVWELEALRAARVNALVACAQRAWRKHRARARLAQRRLARHRAQTLIARAWRAYRETRALPERLALRRRLQARRRIVSLGGAACAAARTWAAGVIWRAWAVWARRRWLRALAGRLRAEGGRLGHASPLWAGWPACAWPALLSQADAALRDLHHRWRCARYRNAFDQTARNRMREKVTASVLFRGRKALYAASVGHPFVGDYVRLRASAQWRRGPGSGADRYLVFADVCGKARAGSGRSGRGAGRVLVAVSTHALLLLDARSLRVKRRVAAHLVYRLSLSPYHDDLLAVHVRPSSGIESSTEELSQCSSREAPDSAGCLFGESRRCGDVVVRAVHVLELATKLFLVVQNAAGRPPIVHIAPMWECSLGGAAVTVCVHPGAGGGAGGVGGGGARLVRRGSRLDVLL